MAELAEGNQNTKDMFLYSCDDKKGQRIEQGWVGETCSRPGFSSVFLFISWQSKICAHGILNAVHLENVKT